MVSRDFGIFENWWNAEGTAEEAMIHVI